MADDCIEIKPEKDNSVLPKLFKVMAAIDRVEKKGVNQHSRYKFLQDVDLTPRVRDEFIKQEMLCLTSLVGMEGTAKDAHPRVQFMFIDPATGDSVTTYGEGMDINGGNKAPWAAITNIRKYMFLNTFHIPTGDDPEGQKQGEADPAGEKPKAEKQAAEKPASGSPRKREFLGDYPDQLKRMLEFVTSNRSVVKLSDWEDSFIQSLEKDYGEYGSKMFMSSKRANATADIHDKIDKILDAPVQDGDFDDIAQAQGVDYE